VIAGEKNWGRRLEHIKMLENDWPKVGLMVVVEEREKQIETVSNLADRDLLPTQREHLGPAFLTKCGEALPHRGDERRTVEIVGGEGEKFGRD
jgi:hypothetical protein